MKLELIFVGKHLGKALFTKRANDGMFFSVPDDVFAAKLIESGVYSLEFTVDHATPKLNGCADVEIIVVNGFVSEEPKFLRTVSGKPLHHDIQNRKISFYAWLDELNAQV
jgi:hypothetical protein